MGKKGQVEVVALFGVIFLVAVVVFYAYQSGNLGTTPVPSGIAEQQKSVKASIDSFIKLGAKEVLANISTYGGYTDEDSFSSDVKFNGRPVPYWQKDGQMLAPNNIYNVFMSGMKDYIENNIDVYINEMGLDNVTVDSSSVSVSGNILPDKILLYVYLPVRVQGYLIQQPLTITVPTRFGEVLELAQGLVNYEIQNRPFEWFTLSSMLMSEPDNGLPTIPFFVAVFDCGKVIMKNWFDIQPAAERAVRLTLAHTYMPGKVPTISATNVNAQDQSRVFSLIGEANRHVASATNFYNNGYYDSAAAETQLAIQKYGEIEDIINSFPHSEQPYPKYSLPPINGKTYSDIDVHFYLPDDFEMSRFRFNFDPDPIIVVPSPVPMTSVCRSDPVYVKYYMRYPMIVSIKDPVTGNIFRFASEVYIDNNAPGTWSLQRYGYSDEQSVICSNLNCNAKIKITGSDGNPITNAHVSFMGCDIFGTTNNDGTLEADIPCGAGLLEVYKNGYKEFKTSISYNQLENYEVTLKKTPQRTIHIYKINVRNYKDGREMSIDNIEPIENMIADVSFSPKSGELCEGDMIYCYRQFSSAVGFLNGIASDSYVVSAQLSDSNHKIWGIAVADADINDDEENLYLYLPYNLDFETAMENSDTTTINSLGPTILKLMNQCGISMFSTKSYDDYKDNVPCVKTYEELGYET